VCPNGKLNKSSFVELYRKMFPEGKSMNFYHHMFRVYDIDRSGTLEFREFIQVRLLAIFGTINRNRSMSPAKKLFRLSHTTKYIET